MLNTFLYFCSLFQPVFLSILISILHLSTLVFLISLSLSTLGFGVCEVGLSLLWRRCRLSLAFGFSEGPDFVGRILLMIQPLNGTQLMCVLLVAFAPEIVFSRLQITCSHEGFCSLSQVYYKFICTYIHVNKYTTYCIYP